jgi:hypothetical protein
MLVEIAERNDDYKKSVIGIAVRATSTADMYCI